MTSTELIKGILTLGGELDNNHGMGSVMIVDSMERLVVKYDKSKLNNIVLADVIDCGDMIHKMRVENNDDKFCPICGKNLQDQQLEHGTRNERL